MSIVRPPPKKSVEAALSAFVGGAPDAPAVAPLASPVKVPGRRGRPTATEKPTLITLKLAPGDLIKLDEAAAERRISRAAFIRQAIFAAIG
jgi:hypothetical protein